MLKQFALAAGFALVASSSQSATLLSEGFDSFPAALAAGWVTVNQSAPVGAFTWGQGFSTSVFEAQAGAPLSYAQSNWQVTDEGGGVIDNWLLTPTLSFGTSNTLSFYSRTAINPSEFPDRLEVRLSTAGASTSTASFSNLLLTINPELTGTGFPGEWTLYTLSFAATEGATGRLAFRATMPDNTAHSDIIGLDTITVTAVPEPGTYALLLLGLGAVATRIRRQSR